jgi:crotonobetainyl-CoA:carnitine CoA-transferase CaiB-like acyl-CoA transferase
MPTPPGAVLDGVRVLDFGRYLAGPYCAALLGELGAEVIRIERPQGAEDRAMVPLAGEAGAMYLAANCGKKSLTLNPKTPMGRDIQRRLLETADVVVANLPPAALKTLGIDFGTVQEVNPRAIVTTISAFGEGPMAERPGFDGLGQAMSGAAHLTGFGHPPLRAGVSWVDYGTATMAAMGTLAALMRRQATGRGEHVQCSLLHTALAFCQPALIEQHVLGQDRQPLGNRSHLAAPSDIFETSDGWVMVYAVGDAMFARWAEMIGEKEQWLADARFQDDHMRGRNSAVISERMASWTRELTTEQVLDEAARWRLPAAPVYSPRQALADADLMGSARVANQAYPGLPGGFPHVPLPATLSGSSPVGRPPQLGEHTDNILAGLGFSAADIEAARHSGAT